ncbi:MAG: helix-turn-helix domain-containing protein [Caenibius sp.]
MTAPIPATARQMDALRYIVGYLNAHHGVAPTYREIGQAIGVNKSTTHRLIECLIERGWLRRIPHLERAIEPTMPVAIPLAPDGAPLFAVPITLEDHHADT